MILSRSFLTSRAKLKIIENLAFKHGKPAGAPAIRRERVLEVVSDGNDDLIEKRKFGPVEPVRVVGGKGIRWR